MSEKCFYCTDELDERQRHFVSFVSSNQERDEILCPDCYQDWLQGLKG
ncbi:hypothetical protein [Bacillus sp. FJAT-29814]|nr:hypothetical protein [Bacillus sp. FJAT-29814]